MVSPVPKDIYDPKQYSNLREYVEAVQGSPLNYDNPQQQDILDAAISSMYGGRGIDSLKSFFPATAATGIATLPTTAAVTTTPTTSLATSLDTGSTSSGMSEADARALIEGRYATIGRTGVGTGANQIDEAGLNAWTKALVSGEFKPEDLNTRFSTAVTDYMAQNPNDQYTNYVKDYLADKTGTATVTGATGNDTTTADDTVSAGDKLLGQILAQGTTSQWTGEGFGSVAANAENMTQLLLDIGITDISQFGVLPVYAAPQEIGKTYNGQRVFTVGDEYNTYSAIRVPDGGVDANGNATFKYVEVPAGAKLETVYGQDNGMGEWETIDKSKLKTVNGQLVYDTGQTTYGNKVTGQTVGNTYGERQTENAFGGTFLGEGNTGYRVKFDAKGNPIFYTTGASSSDIADWGPILSLAAVIPSPIQPFAIAANAAIAIDNGDVFGGIASLAGLAGFSDVAAGARILSAVESKDPFAIVSAVMNSPFGKDIGSTMLTDTISLMDVGNALNVANNVNNGNYAGALTSLGQLTGSSDVKTAAAAARVIKAMSSNNPAAVVTAMAGLDRTIAAANKVTDKNVALNITNTLADANSAATEGTQLASLATDTVSDAGNDLTLSGAGGETLNLDDFSGSDSVAADAELFNNSIGDLDAVGTDTTTGNITDTTGLDTGDVITSVGNITDTTGLDTGDVIPDTDTDTVVDDKGEVVVTAKAESCPIGTVLNPVTGECDPVVEEDKVVVDDKGEVVITAKPESCPVGTVLNPETGECNPVTDEGEIVVTDKRDSCPVGTKLNPETGECDPDWDEGGGEVCGVGERLDPETGMCVPDETKTITCPPGKVLNEAGTACIDETIITDKPESCPVGTVLNRETGECDPVDDTDDEECPEGYVRNLKTGQCEKVEDKSCPVGQVRNADGKCVPVTQPPKPCPTGYQRVGGVCVPIKKVVPPIVPTGYLPSGASGPGERTDPIYAGAMDDFDLFATLEELLKENPDKKKDTKKSKDKTKMATGGHLDDLLAEQMTVDDLLKLLR